MGNCNLNEKKEDSDDLSGTSVVLIVLVQSVHNFIFLDVIGRGGFGKVKA